MRILGVDGGLAGAAALVHTMPPHRPDLRDVIDIPTSGEKAKRRVDAAAFIAWLRDVRPDVAFIERAQAMPQQGSSSGFIYGRAIGYIECCVISLNIPVTFVEAGVWKRAFKLGRDKENARQLALHRFPAAASFFSRKLDHNRAEAALIALHGSAL